MSAQDLEEKRAREFLAAEYERDGKTGSADHIRTQPLLPNKARAVRAIAAALRQQATPVDMEQSRCSVLAFMQKASNAMNLHANPASEFERECYEAAAADFDEARRLLALIDNAGKAECAEVSGCIASVPDKCDRIIWRGQYHHLPPHRPPPVVDDGNGVRACPVLIAARAQGVKS